MHGIVAGSRGIDTSLGAWANFFSERGIASGLSVSREPSEKELLIVSPASLTTAEALALWDGQIYCSFKRFVDAFICEGVPEELWDLDADIILSDRLRRHEPETFAVIVGAHRQATADKAMRGYSSDMAWRTHSGEWYLTLKEYILLASLARHQGSSLDDNCRTVCAGSRVLARPDPLASRDLEAPPRYFIPAAGLSHGILCIERIPVNFRYGDHAPRRILSRVRERGDTVTTECTPMANPESKPQHELSCLML